MHPGHGRRHRTSDDGPRVAYHLAQTLTKRAASRMANAFATPKVYANVGLALLKNELVMAKLCDSEAVNKEFVPGVGTTVYVKRPPEFAIRDGAVASSQDVLEGEVAVTCDKQKGVDVQFTGYEATTNVDQLLKSKVIKGAMTQIASQIDGDLIANVKFFHNAVGTYGNTISTVAGFFAAPQRLDEMAVPMSDRNAILTPNDGYALAGTFTGLAALAGDTAVSALQKAKIPMLGNTDPTSPRPSRRSRPARGCRPPAPDQRRNQNSTYASTRTTGTQTLTLTTGSGKTVKAGEKFTIANVYAVNPRTKAKMTYLKQFTVRPTRRRSARRDADDLAPDHHLGRVPERDLTAAPRPRLPTFGAAVVWFGALSTSYNLNAAFHKSAIKLVSVTRRAPTPARATSPPTRTPGSASATGATRTAPTTCTTIVGMSTTAPRTWTRASARSCSAPIPPPTGRA
jgi:hypothetical protein